MHRIRCDRTDMPQYDIQQELERFKKARSAYESLISVDSFGDEPIAVGTNNTEIISVDIAEEDVAFVSQEARERYYISLFRDCVMELDWGHVVYDAVEQWAGFTEIGGDVQQFREHEMLDVIDEDEEGIDVRFDIKSHPEWEQVR